MEKREMKSSGCNSIWQLQDSGNGITCQQCKILIKGSGKYHEENLCYQHIELLASSL